MPYRINADLPLSVRGRLPAHAQDIYREAFNHALADHCGERGCEEIAHRIAWAAAKNGCEKTGQPAGEPLVVKAGGSAHR